MKTITIIVSEQRDGRYWRIEPQEGCETGVDMVYDQGDGKPIRTCIGDLDDAKALAEAILAYVGLARK